MALLPPKVRSTSATALVGKPLKLTRTKRPEVSTPSPYQSAASLKEM